MKYIKTFNQHTQYEDYINSPDKESPNISYCKDTGDVHYGSTKYIQLKYNVSDISTPTKLFNYVANTITAYDQFESVNIDNKNIPLSNIENGTYQFTETGEHTVKFYIPILNKSITSQLFKNCRNIKSIVIPNNNIDTIGVEAFYNCGNIVSVTLSPNVKTIRNSAFWYNRSLTTINLSNVTTLEREAFSLCTSLNNIDISSLTGEIPELAFNSCGLTSINIPSTVTQIGNTAFSSNSFSELVIPNGVISIGNSAFYYCSQLTSIVFPESLQTLGEGCFLYVSNVQSMVVHASTPPELVNGNSIPTFNSSSSGKIYVPTESLSTYKNATLWNNYSDRIYPIEN